MKTLPLKHVDSMLMIELPKHTFQRLWNSTFLLGFIFIPWHQFTMCPWGTWPKWNRVHKIQTMNKKNVLLVVACLFQRGHIPYIFTKAEFTSSRVLTSRSKGCKGFWPSNHGSLWVNKLCLIYWPTTFEHWLQVFDQLIMCISWLWVQWHWKLNRRVTQKMFKSIKFNTRTMVRWLKENSSMKMWEHWTNNLVNEGGNGGYVHNFLKFFSTIEEYDH